MFHTTTIQTINGQRTANYLEDLVREGFREADNRKARIRILALSEDSHRLKCERADILEAIECLFRRMRQPGFDREDIESTAILWPHITYAERQELAKRYEVTHSCLGHITRWHRQAQPRNQQ